MSFSELTSAKRDHEVVAALGKDIKTGTDLYIIAVYLPPSLNKKKVGEISELISNNISRVKAAHQNIRIIVGGDMNKKKISGAVSDFPLIKKLQTGPTRGNRTLDLIYTDINITSVDLTVPLETEDGVPSDHRTIVATGKLTERMANVTSYFYVQPITKKGRDMFQRLLASTDWNSIITGKTCSESAQVLADILNQYTNECFPKKKCKIRSKDPPWITPEVRKKKKKTQSYL